MGLKDTLSFLQMLLKTMEKDLEKVPKGNRTATQRARVSTLRFEKIAKKFRKESVVAEKKKGGLKKIFIAKKKNSPVQ
jgi:hypothetical protein